MRAETLLLRRSRVLLAATSVVLAAACSLLYGIDGNVGPLADASVLPGEGGVSVDAAPDVPRDAMSDDAAPAPTHWCALHAPDAAFCEDFDESTSATPDGLAVAAGCGAPTLAVDAPVCSASPPNCLAAVIANTCTALERTFPAPGKGIVTVELWLHLDAHRVGIGLNKVADLTFNTSAGPYLVGITDYVWFYLFYDALNSGMVVDNSPMYVDAMAPADYTIVFKVDLDAHTLNGSVNGVTASAPLTLGGTVPSASQVHDVTLMIGIPSSTADAGEAIHMDNVALYL